jgi:hypothetical protein
MDSSDLSIKFKNVMIGTYFMEFEKGQKLIFDPSYTYIYVPAADYIKLSNILDKIFWMWLQTD